MFEDAHPPGGPTISTKEGSKAKQPTFDIRLLERDAHIVVTGDPVNGSVAIPLPARLQSSVIFRGGEGARWWRLVVENGRD